MSKQNQEPDRESGRQAAHDGTSPPRRRAAVCIWEYDTPEATAEAAKALAAHARAQGATVTLRLVVRHADGGRPPQHWLRRLFAVAERRRIDVVFVECVNVFGASAPTILKTARRLTAAGAAIVSVGEPSFDPDAPMADWLAGAEQYRAQLSAAALAEKRARGERAGQVPLGFRVGDDGVSLVPDAREREMIARARDLRAQRLGYRAIARTLTQEGFTSRAGTRLEHPQIRRMLSERRR